MCRFKEDNKTRQQGERVACTREVLADYAARDENATYEAGEEFPDCEEFFRNRDK